MVSFPEDIGISAVRENPTELSISSRSLDSFRASCDTRRERGQKSIGSSIQDSRGRKKSTEWGASSLSGYPRWFPKLISKSLEHYVKLPFEKGKSYPVP